MRGCQCCAAPADAWRGTLKPVSQFKLIGKPAKRVDTAAKVNGTARFGIDTMVEGMRVAAIAMCPRSAAPALAR